MQFRSHLSLCVLPVGAALGAVFSSSIAYGVEYELLTQTRDKITLADGKARVGSFGAPAINNKGDVAYACILAGVRVDSLSNNAVVFDRSGKRRGKLAVQSGLPLDNSFLPTTTSNSERPVPDTATMYRISRNVAINNKRKINFAGEQLYWWEIIPDSGASRFESRSRPTYGTVFPSGSSFQSVALSNFEQNESSDILEAGVCISSKGAISFNALAILTDERNPLSIYVNKPVYMPAGNPTRPGTVWGYQFDIVASVDSTVIGLPYSTTFTDFSDPVIAKQDRVFLVADISDTGDEFDGIWQGTNPNLRPVVVKGSASPLGGEFQSFDETVAPSPNGQHVAFVANINDGSSPRAAFRCARNGKDLITIAAVDKPAPGTDGTFDAIHGVGVNNRGQVVLHASMKRGNGNPRDGIWLSDSTGEDLRLVVLEGRPLEMKRKKEFPVSSLTFNPLVGLNRKGQVVFTATFSNRQSVVYIATL